MPDPPWPPEAAVEPPVPVDPPDVADPPAPLAPTRPPVAPPLPPTGAPLPPTGVPPLPPVDPSLPRADDPPLEPPAPPRELTVAPPDADAPVPTRPPVPVAPGEPPPWPPVPLLGEGGEAQLQSSAAIARAARHADCSGPGTQGLWCPCGSFGKPVPCARRRRERCDRDRFMKTPWDVPGSYSLRARQESSQFVTAASFRGVPVGAVRRRGSTPTPSRTIRGRLPPRARSDGDRDQSNRGAGIPIPD